MRLQVLFHVLRSGATVIPRNDRRTVMDADYIRPVRLNNPRFLYHLLNAMVAIKEQEVGKRIEAGQYVLGLSGNDGKQRVRAVRQYGHAGKLKYLSVVFRVDARNAVHMVIPPRRQEGNRGGPVARAYLASVFRLDISKDGVQQLNVPVIHRLVWIARDMFPC